MRRDRPTELLEIDNLRKSLYSSQFSLSYDDLGGKSLTTNSKTIRVSTIAKNMAIPLKFGRMLFFLVEQVKPKSILEIGTSLGLSTSYLCIRGEHEKCITLDGNPEVLKVTRQNFEKLGLSSVNIYEGSFDHTLPEAINDLGKVDMVFFDGNHQLEPTLDYFNKCKAIANENAVFIFDDIRWSAGMEQAWDTIRSDPRLTVTIDLFSIGLGFFRPGQEKEHFVLRY